MDLSGPKSKMTSVLTGREKDTQIQTHAQREDDRGKLEAEIGVMQLQDKEFWQPLGGGKEEFFPREFGRNVALRTSYLALLASRSVSE